LHGQQQRNPLAGALRWRNIGPFRGGRVPAVAGIATQPFVSYLGSTGGGVSGAEDNPNIVYVGMGEACLRGNISTGDGIYKSIDAGKTWAHVGLADSSQIGRMRIHPSNPDLVYVAAIGHPYGPNAERGVFRTKDGGKSWQKVLFVDDKTGAADIAMDP